MAGSVRIGDTGSVTWDAGADTAADPSYDETDGALFHWSYTVEQDEFDDTDFALAYTRVQHRSFVKGLYVIRGSLEGFWDSGLEGLTDAAVYSMLQASRTAQVLTLVSRTGTGGAGAKDQNIVLNAHMNNMKILTDIQGGLITFTADFVSQGTIASTQDFVAGA